MEDCISSWLGVSEASGKKFESWREPFIAGIVRAAIIDHPQEDIEPPHFRHRFKSVLIPFSRAYVSKAKKQSVNRSGAEMKASLVECHARVLSETVGEGRFELNTATKRRAKESLSALGANRTG